MKKKILTQLFIVSFAFAGLFLVVKNVNANPINPPGMEIPPAIICGQHHGACWGVSEHSNCSCIFLGKMGTHCVPC